jgi:hypothetical protein
MGRIIAALAKLVREAYMDELPSEEERDEWKKLAHDGRIEYDDLKHELAALREQLAEVIKQRDRLRGFATLVKTSVPMTYLGIEAERVLDE